MMMIICLGDCDVKKDGLIDTGDDNVGSGGDEIMMLLLVAVVLIASDNRDVYR